MSPVIWDSLAVAAAALIVAATLPGIGTRRRLRTRRQLHADVTRLEGDVARLTEANDGLVGALVRVCGEVDALRAHRDEAWAALGKAEPYIADLEEQARELPQLRETNRALRAQLANATAVSQKATAGSDDENVPRGIPVVNGAAFASTDPGRTRA